MAYPPPQPDQWYGQQPGGGHRPQEPPFGPPGHYGHPAYHQPYAQHSAAYGSGQQYGQHPGSYGLPQPYGRPGQWPAPPVRKKRRTWFWLSVLALLIVVLVVVPTILRGRALDPRAVQRDVAGQYEKLNGVPVALRCPDDMAIQTGRTYRCTGTTAGGDPVTITITVTGQDASYTWEEA